MALELFEKDSQCTIKYEDKILVIPSKELIRILEQYVTAASDGAIKSS